MIQPETEPCQEGTHEVIEGFSSAYSSALHCLRNISVLRKCPYERIRQTAMDVTIVAFGIRLGYLFDAFGIRNKHPTPREVLSDWLATLRKISPIFRGVILAHEPTSDQLFFVNASLMRKLASSSQDTIPSGPSTPSAYFASHVTFIRLEGSHILECGPSSQLQSLICDLASKIHLNHPSHETIMLPEDDRTRDIGTMVSFAACVLEFPVAYVPATDVGGPFLAGVPLDVYECVLELDAGGGHDFPDKHTMVKFSCPQAVARGRPELHTDAIIARLEDLFVRRLRDAMFPGSMIVRHSVETLDRVSL